MAPALITHRLAGQTKQELVLLNRRVRSVLESSSAAILLAMNGATCDQMEKVRNNGWVCSSGQGEFAVSRNNAGERRGVCRALE